VHLIVLTAIIRSTTEVIEFAAAIIDIMLGIIAIPRWEFIR